MRKQLIFLGAPGSGKGTQAKRLVESLDYNHVSTGDLLRKAIEANRPLVNGVGKVINAGQLAPDEVILKLLTERLEKKDCEGGYIFDGFPRRIVQAEGLMQSDIFFDFVLLLDVPDGEVVGRLSRRYVHVSSGRVYHPVHNPPKVSGVDDETGELLIQRDDDREEIVRERLRVYRAETKPVFAYYTYLNETGDKYAPKVGSVSGIGSVHDVTRRVFLSLR